MLIALRVPDPDVLLGMAPEELAGPLLFCLIDLERSGTRLNRYNYGLIGTDGYPEQRRAEIGYALMEAWAVLENEVLLAPWPGTQGEWVFVTRRGQQLQTPEAFRAYRASELLPREALHPALVPRVRAAFARGDYDTAVFEAFKELEVRVRLTAKMTEADYGTDLMRRAFHVDRGPLSNLTAPAAERQALSDLFSGAIGSYKNPHSHRRIRIEAREAAEMLILASHLLNIVDSRTPGNKPLRPTSDSEGGSAARG